MNKNKEEILKEFEKEWGKVNDQTVMTCMNGKGDLLDWLSQALDQAEQNVINKIKEMEKGDEPIVSASAMIVLEELKNDKNKI